MEIILKTSGTIERFFPEKEIRFVLKKGAALSDLYEMMGRLNGSKISAAIWNHGKNRFRGPVIVSSGGRLLKNEDEILYNGQIIELKRFLIGG
jgi:hypothetical protein